MLQDVFSKQSEKRILAIGFLSLFGLFALLAFYAVINPKIFNILLSITASNILFGRMSGLSIGIAFQMNTFWLILFNLLIETILVLIFYPLFVMSWERLHIIPYAPLRDFFRRSQENAQKYEPLIKKYGIIGLILFVLFPLNMTGPVAGSFVGYLMGLGHLTTILVVILSTFGAIIVWTYLIKNFEATLIVYSDTLIAVLSITAVIVLLWYFVRRKFLNGNKKED